MNQYRILIPSEYEVLLDAIEKERLRVCIETLMNTGMRYSELERFADDLSMFDAKNRAITLPAKDSKTGKERVIHLTPAFSKRLYQYLREHKSLEVPTRRSMDENLKRWCAPFFDTNRDLYFNHPSTKTFRKTWETWLLVVKRDDGSDKYSSRTIAESMGHSELISMKHYANRDPRLKSEMDAVKRITEGWGT